MSFRLDQPGFEQFTNHELLLLFLPETSLWADISFTWMCCYGSQQMRPVSAPQWRVAVLRPLLPLISILLLEEVQVDYVSRFRHSGSEFQ